MRRLAFVFVFLVTACFGAAPGDSGRQADQDALKPFAGFVGDWRGVGQPERGKTRGAWRETADWAWKLSKDSAALALTVKEGKYLKSGLLKPGKEPGSFVFKALLADDTERTFQGKADDETKPLILNAEGDGAGLRRIKFTTLHETRLLVLLESEESPKLFHRLGEIGYTREGVAFASGDGAPLCIVTEGRGTMKVSHKGQTYYVCCSGCKDLFEDDPEEVLAAAEERKKDKEKEKVSK